VIAFKLGQHLRRGIAPPALPAVADRAVCGCSGHDLSVVKGVAK